MGWRILFLFFLYGLLAVPPICHALNLTNNIVCGKDLNGDGVVTGNDGNELQACFNSLCPVDAVPCISQNNTTYVDPTCPGGGSNDPLKQLCEYTVFSHNNGSDASFNYSGQMTVLAGDQVYFSLVKDFANTCQDTSFKNSVQINGKTIGILGASSDMYCWQIGDDKAKIITYTVPADGTYTWKVTGSALDYGDWYITSHYKIYFERPYSCSAGVFDPTTGKCVVTNNVYDCPYGKQYSCVTPQNGGVPECSDLPCVNLATNPVQSAPPPNTTSYQNDGTTDPSTGACTGIIKIFNGKGDTCRQAGWDTNFFNCCNSDEGSFLLIKKYCNQNDIDTVAAIQAKYAHYVGDYCQKSIPLIGCIQKVATYCIFHSQFGRIIQEQGRPTLKAFAPDGQWGTPEAPNCVGFSPEEFQMIDFSKIDFSEIFGDITPNTTAIESTKNDAASKLNNYINNIEK